MDAARRRHKTYTARGALRGEHPGRSRNPLIKVRDLAWLEFEKPDLVRAEAFARAFGFTTVLHTADELHLRGTDAGSPCVIVRRGTHSRFVGRRSPQDTADVERLASATGSTTRTLPEAIGGVAVELTDQRDSGPRRRRDARVGRAARATAAHLQLRARVAPRQRHPAPAARTRPGAEVGSRRAAEHEVHRDA